MARKKWFFPFLLVGLFVILVLLTIPKGYVYGSYTDWLSQHVRLAETIRSACIEQKTLTPAFLPLGGGSNGYQFSYYGYLRPDIIIGCLFPSIPMGYLLIGYMLAGYISAVLLCYYWLRLHLQDSRAIPFWGSILFMTAACFFQAHRQVMFVNYMPFLILALIAVRKKHYRALPLILLLIYVNSFYYSIACLAVIGWYWLRQDGKTFWTNGFLTYLKATFLSIGMAALLLMPTALVILEHRRVSGSLSLSEICGLSLNLQPLLYSPYGMGLTAVCLYALLLGLAHKKFRLDSIFLLAVTTWSLAAWLLNGTLYTRAKILIPFVPLVVLQCSKVFHALFIERFLYTAKPQENHDGTAVLIADITAEDDMGKQNRLRWKLWPCIILAATLPFWMAHKNFIWIAADVLLLTCIVLMYRLADVYLITEPQLKSKLVRNINCKKTFLHLRDLMSCGLLCLMPCLLFFQTAQKENFVKREDISQKESILNSVHLEETDSLYRYDSLSNTLNTGNLATQGKLQKSSMYSSITNQDYSDVYYETFQSPVQINNSLAILPSSNPFLLNFLGVRYIETTADHLPNGYRVVSPYDKNIHTSKTVDDSARHLPKSNDTATVIAENTDVLPIAYLTDSYISESQFQALDSYGKLDAITRYTIVPDIGNSKSPSAENEDESSSSNIAFDEVKNYVPNFDKISFPGTIQAENTGNGYLMKVKKDTDLALTLKEPLKEQILLLDFEVENKSGKAVVIDINHMRNKLSGSTAPYPNGNFTFHYQFSDSQGKGLNTLNITFSKGKYLLKEINWHTYSKPLLNQKKYTPVENQETKGSEILSCTASAQDDSYFVTSIPMQKGMKIWVDGKTVPILKVNQAFAGAALVKGKHDIRITFAAPGQRAGYILSLISFLIYLLPAIFRRTKTMRCCMLHNYGTTEKHLRKKVLNMKAKKELLCYCISGGATTFVNYLIYFILLKVNVTYLAANTFAWIGAVLTAYVMNRKWVFHSNGHVFQEFCSFVFLRFLTLLTENALLWITVSLLGVSPLLSKILVSIVTVLANYALCKYKIFHKEELNHG